MGVDPYSQKNASFFFKKKLLECSKMKERQKYFVQFLQAHPFKLFLKKCLTLKKDIDQSILPFQPNIFSFKNIIHIYLCFSVTTFSIIYSQSSILFIKFSSSYLIPLYIHRHLYSNRQLCL